MNEVEVRKAKRWSWPVIGLASVGVLGLNFGAGHYRQVLLSSQHFKESMVAEHLWQHPLDLSLSSVLLMVAGGLCAGLAAYKAHTASDKFPGFEKVDRAYRQGVDAQDDLKNAIEGELDAIRVSDVDGLAEKLGAERGMLDDVRRRVSGLILAKAKAARLDHSDVEAAEAVVERYKKLNLQIRSDGQVPKAFAAPTGFVALIPEVSAVDMTADIEAVATLQASVASGLSRTVERERARIGLAKENTERTMRAVAQKKAEEALDLAELKRLLQAAETRTQEVAS